MKLSGQWILFSAVILVSGCASKKTATAGTSIAPAPQMIVTSDNSLDAKVVRYNSAGRFVILNFPDGQMPQIGQAFFLYRSGLKVAEIKISGPQTEDNIAADLMSGDAQVGDEVRDQ